MKVQSLTNYGFTFQQNFIFLHLLTRYTILRRGAFDALKKESII